MNTMNDLMPYLRKTKERKKLLEKIQKNVNKQRKTIYTSM